jgi:hypothetical protein
VRDAADNKEPPPPRAAVPATGKPRSFGPDAPGLAPQPQT